MSNTVLRNAGFVILAALLCPPVLCGCDEGASVQSASTAAATPKIADENVEASLAAVDQYMQTAEWVKAEAIMRTLLRRAPDDARVLEMMGRLDLEKAGLAEQAGDTSKALELKKQAWQSYEQAVRLEPNSAGLAHSAGLVAATVGDSNAALAMFQKAESLDRTNPQFPLYAAQVLIQQQRLDEAESSLRRVLALRADEPLAHASLAMIALERGEMDAALAEIRTARAALPDDAGLRAQEAKVHRRRGETRQALELLVGLDAASRAQEAVAYEIAAGYAALNEPAKAAAAWGLSASGNPHSPTAYLAAVHAAELYLLAGDTIEAAKWGRVAEDLRPDAPEVAALLAKLRAAS